jgi:hypothetical protein
MVLCNSKDLTLVPLMEHFLLLLVSNFFDFRASAQVVYSLSCKCLYAKTSFFHPYIVGSKNGAMAEAVHINSQSNLLAQRSENRKIRQEAKF